MNFTCFRCGEKSDRKLFEGEEKLCAECVCNRLFLLNGCYIPNMARFSATSAEVETDPTGKNAHEPGAKLDAGKVRMGLVLGGFGRALKEVGKVGTYGAEKYTDNGWMEVPDGVARYSDALFRHIFSEACGEEIDADTGLHHAAHAAWNALARLDLILRDRDSEH